MKKIKKTNIKFISVNNVKVISSTLALSSALTGCLGNANGSILTSETVLPTESSTITSEILPETTEIFESESHETLNTVHYSCPVEYNDELSIGFIRYMQNKYGENGIDNMTIYGFDNPMLNNSLREYILQTYNINDPDITIDNFHYFQFLKYNFCGEPYNGLNTHIGNIASEKFEMSLARSVLIEENLRFLVDEIPYSYFEKRFPEFMSNIENNSYRNNIRDCFISIFRNKIDWTKSDLDQLNRLSEYDYDVILFWSLCMYNSYRNSFLYAPDVKQVRDETTGKHILVPDANQLRHIENVMDNYEGYDFTITEPESREHYYQYFGYYPEDVVNENRIYEGNKSSERSR